MANGYDTRQGARGSFAPEALPPVQTTTGASGESAQVQQIGGESTSGMRGREYTRPGSVGGELGAFIEQVMAPEVARRKQAEFFKGYTEAQSGVALEELTNNDSPLTRIFGPSGFAQGAQFYAGQAAINEWQSSTMADMDNLKRLPPPELARHMAASYESMMTGDPFADQMIQAGLLEAQAPVIAAQATARFEWQQTEAITAVSTAANGTATNLQSIVSAHYRSGGTGDDAAIVSAFQRFGGMMQQPDGMTDENYQKMLYDVMRRNQAEGNFYAVRYLQEAGVADALTDDQVRNVEAGYDRHSQRSMDVAFAEPDILEIAMRIDARTQLAEITDEDPMTVPEVVEGYARINELVRQRTGVDEDYFSADDLRQAGGRLMNAQVGRLKAAQTRAAQIEDRNYRAEERRQIAVEEASAKLATVSAIWATGSITPALAADPTLGAQFNTVAMQQYSEGNYTGIAKAFQQSGWTSAGVGTMLQTMARTGIGEEYTQATAAAFEVWKSFNQISPALSEAYFGDYDAAFQTFSMQVRTSGPQIAYRDAFSRAGGYGASNIPQGDRAAFNEALTNEIAEHSFGITSPSTWGNSTLNGAGRRALESTITDHFARLSAGGNPRTAADLVDQVYNAAIREGRFEQYGSHGWANRRGTTPLNQVLGLQAGEARRVIGGEIAARLTALGVTDHERSRVIRVGNNLIVEGYARNGDTVQTLIPLADLRARATERVRSQRAPALDTSGFNGPMGY